MVKLIILFAALFAVASAQLADSEKAAIRNSLDLFKADLKGGMVVFYQT